VSIAGIHGISREIDVPVADLTRREIPVVAFVAGRSCKSGSTDRRIQTLPTYGRPDQAGRENVHILTDSRVSESRSGSLAFDFNIYFLQLAGDEPSFE
jgi:hypothetical protein